MFQGYYGQGNAARPHQALARALFTHNVAQTHEALLRLGVLVTPHMDAELFEAIIVNHSNENVEDVAKALANSVGGEEERQKIREWALGKGSQKLVDMVGSFAQSKKKVPQMPTASSFGPSTAPSTPVYQHQQQEEQSLRTPLNSSLVGLLSDFLTMSSSSNNSEDDASSCDENDDDDDEGGEEEAVATTESNNRFDWVPNIMPPNDEAHQYFYTLYFRMAGARALSQSMGRVKANHIKERVVLCKLQRFMEAHWLACQWVKERGPLALTLHAFQRLYGSGCGPAGAYGPDAALIKTQRHAHQTRERPLEILERVFPRAYWRPEQVPMEALERLGKTPRILQPQMVEGEVTWYGWAPVANILPITHSLYYGVVYVLNQCMRTLKNQQQQLAPEVSYALWVYYVSWTELFVHCLPATGARMDDAYLRLPRGSYMGRDGIPVYGDGASPWSLWGTCDVRTFCAGDLPDFFSMLVTIPLRGDQHIPSYFLGKLYQKALPFAGMRRHIIKLAVKCILDHPPFWKLFSKLMWVMLANLYPGELAGPYNRLGMRSLLRIHELCNNRDMMMGVLLAQQPGMKDLLVRPALQQSQDPFLAQVARAGKPGPGSNGGPLIVATMFRLHILYMGSFNPVYVERAQKLIDWDYHKKDAVRLANIIRQHGLWAQDAFAPVRIDLGKTVKSPHSHVHRIRKHSVAVTLRERMDEALEKDVFRNRYDYLQDIEALRHILQQPTQEQRSDLFFSTTKCAKKAKEEGLTEVTDDAIRLALSLAEAAVQEYDKELDLPMKSAILNALLCVDPEDRLSRPTMAGLLLQPQYGGMTPRGVELMWQLVLVVSDKAVPKDFSRYMTAFDLHDLLLATYYFNAVALLEKIHFVPLDRDTIERTEQTMQARELGKSTEAMYEVAISLCCDRVCTLMGQEKFGNRRVSFDLEKKQLVCVHNKPSTKNQQPPPAAVDAAAAAQSEEEEEEEEEHDDDEDNDDDDEDEEDQDHAVLQQAAQNAHDDELDHETIYALEGVVDGDLIGDATAMGGKGAKKVKVMQDRKVIRNQRKTFSKVPCGQPVLVVSLRGRALIWGNLRDKRVQIMFCPQCGGLHTYTVFGFSKLEDPSKPGPYRCMDCMRAELTHVPYLLCAYCSKPAISGRELEIMTPCTDATIRNFDPLSADGRQHILRPMPFCESHYKIAIRYHQKMSKTDLWRAFKYIQEKRALRRAVRGHRK